MSSVQTFSLTNGGTAQKMMTANADCVSLIVQAITETSFINFGATAGVQATGTYTLAVKPTINDTLLFNGVTFTFVAAAASNVQITIGATLATAIANAIAVLNASTNASVALATYSSASGDTSDGIITVTAVAGGTDGNSYTLGSTGGNVTRSAATLAGGLNTLGGIELVKDTFYEFTDRSYITKDIYIVSPTDAAKSVYLVGTGGRGLG